MFKKLGGPSSPSVQPPRTSAPTGAAPATARPAPASTPTATSAPQADGFSGARRPAGSHVPSAQASQTTSRAAPKPGDVTTNFHGNPVGFATQNTLNAYNALPPAGLPAPTPNAPFVPAAQSTVTLNVNQQKPGANANLSFNPPDPTKPTQQAHYLPYLPQGGGHFGGISGVPQHPPPGAPTTIVTGPLNGCAVHAFHDTNTGTMSFLHHANYSQNGKNELNSFMQARPNLQHAATVGPQDYAHWNGKIAEKYDPPRKEETGATVFAQYVKPPGQQQGQWHLVGQLNDFGNGAGQAGRPELVRPTFGNTLQPPTAFLYQPIPPPTP